MNEMRAKIGQNGRVVIPASVRKSMGLRIGEDVLLRFDGEQLHILSQEASVRRAQALVRHYIPANRSLVDELLAERRADAAGE
jgi:AbrB family looped-hinge helix DNA binding protein